MAKNYIGENFKINKVLMAIHQNRIQSNLLKFLMKSDGIIFNNVIVTIAIVIEVYPNHAAT